MNILNIAKNFFSKGRKGSNLIDELSKSKIYIESERLIIHPIIFFPHEMDYNESVLNDLFEIYCCPENVSNYSRVYDSYEEFAQYILQRVKVHQLSIKGITIFLIQLKSNRKYIGLRSIILDGVYTLDGKSRINNENVISEIVINKDYWRKGIAFEASTEIFKLLKNYGVKNVVSFVDQSNLIAARLDWALGFKIINFNEVLSDYKFDKDCIIHSGNSNQGSIFLKTL